MDTKWKNNGRVVIWLLLLAYGLDGVSNLLFGVNNYAEQNLLFWIYSVGGVVALVFGLMLIRNHSGGGGTATAKGFILYRKIPIDVGWFLFGITILILLAFFSAHSYLYFAYPSEIITGLLYHLVLITVVFSLALIQGIYLYQRQKEAPAIRREWGDALIAQFIRAIRNAFLNRRVGTQVFLILTVVFLLGLLTGLTGVDADFIAMLFPALVVIGIPLFILLVKRTGYFNKILAHAETLANGELAPDLKIKGKSVLAELAEDINEIKHGVQVSQTAQIKSERLKTELITNVSHDLRTPLTSIMTYSDLLKNPDLSAEERASYVEIIDRKSKRLKVLIDDLFEASKMASGNIELAREKVDIVQLLQQALAEQSEAIQDSSIQFRVTGPDSPVYALVDGQKLWRVFENLISNILKYSLPSTRAYIQIKEEQGEVLIAFKNISEYELGDNLDELTERFKRGDEARHTDGSGLGLAIANSIIDLHDGSLDIEMDGDLFKVTIRLGLLNHHKTA